MTRTALLSLAALALGAVADAGQKARAPAAFAEKPKARLKGGKYVISFAAKKPCDCGRRSRRLTPTTQRRGRRWRT